MKATERLRELGLELPKDPEGGGLYAQVKTAGELIFVAGCGPTLDGVQKHRGVVGREVSVEQGRECARDCVLNILASVRDAGINIDEIKSFLKMTVYVACVPGFQGSPKVANGATELLKELYGEEKGLPVRTAVGVNSLTDDFPVEIDVILKK